MGKRKTSCDAQRDDERTAASALERDSAVMRPLIENWVSFCGVFFSSRPLDAEVIQVAAVEPIGCLVPQVHDVKFRLWCFYSLASECWVE